MKITSSGVRYHVVWYIGSNVSEETAASIFLNNAATYLSNYTAPDRRKPQSSFTSLGRVNNSGLT
jgi:hypothetical protein